MKTLKNIVVSICFISALVGTISSAFAVYKMGEPQSYTQKKDDRVILGHRIDSQGQSQLVYQN